MADNAAPKLRSAIEEHGPGTYWGPDGAQMSRDELLALLDVVEAAEDLLRLDRGLDRIHLSSAGKVSMLVAVAAHTRLSDALTTLDEVRRG